MQQYSFGLGLIYLILTVLSMVLLPICIHIFLSSTLLQNLLGQTDEDFVLEELEVFAL